MAEGRRGLVSIIVDATIRTVRDVTTPRTMTWFDLLQHFSSTSLRHSQFATHVLASFTVSKVLLHSQFVLLPRVECSTCRCHFSPGRGWFPASWQR
jgi:hypothetical protein